MNAKQRVNGLTALLHMQHSQETNVTRRGARHAPGERGIFWPEKPWKEARENWRDQGMPDDYDFHFDFDEDMSRTCLGVNLGFCPAFERKVLKDEGDKLLIQDTDGIIKRVYKDERSGMPQFVEFPVNDRKTWEDIKKRLDPENPDRFPADWSERVQRLQTADVPITTPRSHYDGFFGYLRELCGDNVYYLLYDNPDLIKAMLDFQVYRLTTLLKKMTQDIAVDRHYIWEDMCYKSGPLIGPQQFQDFLLEPYQRVLEVSRQCGIPLRDVDSDGNIEKLLPLWIEAGVEMIHPLEVASGMDIVRLTEVYQDKIIFRGGIDKREIAKGRPAIDVEIERIRPAYEMGGYIPTIDHSVPPDICWQDYQYYHQKRAQLVGVTV